MKKTIFSSLLALSAATAATAQNDIDALRYSNNNLGGSTRFLTMGGAFGALGGDFSSLGLNPAGGGVYRRNELLFSTGLYSNTQDAKYLGTSTSQSQQGFNINSAGFVYAERSNDDNDRFNGYTCGVGYNRLNNFNSTQNFQGVNNNSSLLDNFTQTLNNNNGGAGTKPHTAFKDFNYGAGLAYDTYLLNPGRNSNSDTLHYFNLLEDYKYGQLQKRSSKMGGSQGETFFNLSTSYGNKLFLGLSVGFQGVKYSETTTFSESDINNHSPYLKDYSYTTVLNTSGTGANLKLGAIYQATKWLRLGYAWHSGTYFSLTDVYSSSVVTNLDSAVNGKTQYTSASTAEGTFNYTISSPGKNIFSLAFIKQGVGLISADYELINYANMELNSSDYAFIDENQTIKDKYQSVVNVRLGAELILNTLLNGYKDLSKANSFPNFALRGGYGYYPNPIKSEYTQGLNAGRQNVSLGLGLRGQYAYFDIGYVLSSWQEYLSPYSLSDGRNVEAAKINRSTGIVSMTVGLRF